ncbi:MAG: hypothetical protein AAGD38_14025 [Acidobacteriota bacterium]
MRFRWIMIGLLVWAPIALGQADLGHETPERDKPVEQDEFVEQDKPGEEQPPPPSNEPPTFGAPTTPARPAAPVCRGLVLTADGANVPRTSFAATEILDLDVRTRLAATVRGDHTLRVELETPKGFHYQTLDAPIRGGVVRAGEQRMLAGYPRPLAIVPITHGPRSSRRGPEAVISVPVAGTTMVSSGLYGTWTVRSFVDDTPCGETTFDLEP